MDPARRRATYEDLLALPEDARAEIVNGEIVLLPSPLPEHGRAQGALWRFIGGPYDQDDGLGGPGGWWILLEVDVRLAAHETVRPDLAGWPRERLPAPWGQRPIELAPDWVCEVISPGNAGHDRVTKRDSYARHGVGHYWIVDPLERTLEGMRLVEGGWPLVGSFQPGDIARIPPFEDVELDVGRLFPPGAPEGSGAG